jgi:hypothetical protein
MPVTADPAETSAVISCTPPPLSPLAWAGTQGAQLDPVAEVQI